MTWVTLEGEGLINIWIKHGQFKGFSETREICCFSLLLFDIWKVVKTYVYILKSHDSFTWEQTEI